MKLMDGFRLVFLEITLYLSMVVGGYDRDLNLLALQVLQALPQPSQLHAAAVTSFVRLQEPVHFGYINIVVLASNKHLLMNRSKVITHLHKLKICDLVLYIQQGVCAILGTILWRVCLPIASKLDLLSFSVLSRASCCTSYALIFLAQ